MKWNPQQDAAITNRGKNLIVAAAAGSGKTAVLVERIKRLILGDQVNIDEFLIVTFTNAAAAEMKEKLIKAIVAELKKEGADTSFLKKQLDLINSANISTFHSFALQVIRRYFYLTDLDPDFKIGDEGAVEIIKRDVLDELFDDYFESGSEEFLDFLRAYSSDRNEKAIKENILGFYNKLQSIPHPYSWLEEHVENLKMDKEAFMGSDAYAFIHKDIEYSVEQIITSYRKAADLANEAGAEGIYKKCETDLISLEAAVELAEKNRVEELGILLKAFKPLKLVPNKNDKQSDYEAYKEQIKKLREQGKKHITGLLNRYFVQSMDTYIEDMQQVYPMAAFLKQLILDFGERFKNAKHSRKIIDFADIEHYALEILEYDDVASEYRDKFRYVFVDEYQDSNVMQDRLINRVKREDNLFVVGDVKQCIYKFRLAEPEIFQARYKEYADETCAESEKIDLNRNYRSKKAVIDTVNEIFDILMKGYDDAAKLKQGDEYAGQLDYPTELHLVDNQITKNLPADNELADMKKAELEARYVVNLINEVVGTEIFDSKQGCVRKVTLRDIVILMRSTKDFAEIYQQVFKDNDIPSYVDDSSGFFDTVEIQVFLNLLTIIDNMQQDVPLLSVMNSSICNFSIDELARIRLAERKGSFYDAMCIYRHRPDELGGKVDAFFEQIENYRSMAKSLPLEEFVWKLIWETGYYTYCGALPAGSQRQANLKALADRARLYKETGYGGIYGFLTYMRAIEKREIPMGQVKLVNENEDLVRIMTIHKSKGLEFPVVIVAGLGKKLNISNGGGSFDVHKDFGVGMTRVSADEHWKKDTFLKILMEQKVQQDEREENIRVLYVALTRAKDRLILVGTGDFYDNNGELKTSASNATYIDYLISVKDDCSFKLVPFDREKIGLDESKRINKRMEARKMLDEIIVDKDSEYDDLDRRFTFKYANETALGKKSKYSVTEYSKQGTVYGEAREQLKLPAFMQTESAAGAAVRGTVMHKVMEVIDFRAAYETVISGNGTAFVEEQLRRMVTDEMLTEEEAGFVETERILGFFRTDIGRRAAFADELYKEAEFNFLKESDGVPVMVQGVIDCFFSEGDKYVLIDYKNSYIDPERKEEGLKRITETYTGQVEIYREALQVITGREVSESYLYLFSEGEFVEIQ